MGLHSYSYKNDGSTSLSANFKVSEFRCFDGSDPIFIDDELVEVLQDVRNHFGKACTVTSAYRTPTHNSKVGGVWNSKHLYGQAADIVISGIPASSVYSYLDGKYPDTYGIGKYTSFTHIDVRKNKSRWEG